MRRFAIARIVAAAILLVGFAASACADAALVPAPASLRAMPCTLPLSQTLRFDAHSIDRNAFALLRDRWIALGIRTPVLEREPRGPASVVATMSRGRRFAAGYRLDVSSAGVRIDARWGEPRFDALMTLAQMPERRAGVWALPCVAIRDAPAMRWRIVSDDVSRGPFPTMAYAKERIRTLATFKMNGWSPYMEQVVVDRRAPYVASPNGWTTSQLHELAAYARRYYVTLIPEQQTFAHMHETLKWETFAPLAELPHGYLLAESDPQTYAYLEPLVASIAAAAAPIPFMHLGADEPIDLGRGRTARSAQTFAAHVVKVAAFLPSGVRPMIWDDAIAQDRSILDGIPRDTIVVAFHYGVESSYRGYLDPLAHAGFASMIAPGAANWNEVYPDLATSYVNVARFAADGRATNGMLGMFMTVWHDDGESLYDATWPAVAYAAASAWQPVPVDDASWHRAFAAAYFGTNDARYSDALDRLRDLRTLLRTNPSDSPDYVFWHDPFADDIAARVSAANLTAIRVSAEAVMTELDAAHPPLNAHAASVMRLAAARYDQLARRLQIGTEARAFYEDARAVPTGGPANRVYRSLGVAKYLCWEMRDALTALAPQYASAWRYESTEPGLERVLVRYRLAEADAQRCADRIDDVMREHYLRHATVPPWDETMRERAAP